MTRRSGTTGLPLTELGFSRSDRRAGILVTGAVAGAHHDCGPPVPRGFSFWIIGDGTGADRRGQGQQPDPKRGALW